MSFLSFPPELRCLVYAHTASSHETFREYHGLYLSCKLIKQEMDHEQKRVIQSHIEDLQSKYEAEGGVELSLTLSTTDAISRNLQLSLPVSKCYHAVYYYARLPSHEELLHFTTLTVDCHNNSGEQLQGVNARNVERLLEHLLVHYFNARALKRIAVSMVPADLENAIDWLKLLRGARAPHLETTLFWRRCKRVVMKDEGVEVTWERRKEELEVANTRSFLPVLLVTFPVAGMLVHIIANVGYLICRKL
jgi:hypothetical protein